MIPDAITDLELAGIATGTKVAFCSGEPANYAGIAAVKLAEQTVTAGSGNGDFTIEAGDTSGRQLMLEAQTGIVPTSNGTVTFYAVHDAATLLATTPVTSQPVTTSQVWATPRTKIVERKAPTYA